MIVKQGLELSALILGIVNGLILLHTYLRDKPKLATHPVNEESYQWYFRLPEGTFQDHTTRRYGFLAYMAISNRGIRDVALNSWRLILKTQDRQILELKPMSMPEPQFVLGRSGSVKVWAGLGQKGLYHDGDTMIKSGASVSGFAYYIAEVYGDKAWDPLIENGAIVGRFEVRSIFGNKAISKVAFKEIPLDQAKAMVEGIELIDEAELWAKDMHD